MRSTIDQSVFQVGRGLKPIGASSYDMDLDGSFSALLVAFYWQNDNIGVE